MTQYIIANIIAALVVGLVLFSASGVQAQEQVDDIPSDNIANVCMPMAIDTRLVVGNQTKRWLSFDGWESLLNLPGRNVFLHDVYAWYVPENTPVLFQVRGHSVEDYHPVMVWFAYAGGDEWYLFYFPETTPFADANGNHYGVHPNCGGYAVPYEEVMEWLRGIA